MIAGVVGIAAAPTRVPAQTPTETAAARQSFHDGVTAARAERWDEAVEHFQRSFELSPRPITMMNLAGALSQLGRLVEAAEAYRSFLAMARTGRAARLRREAEEQLRALEQRIPRVRLRVLGLQDGDILRLDEYEMSPSTLDLPLPVDPGSHTVTIVRNGIERSVPFSASEGVASEVVLDARPEAFAGRASHDDVTTDPARPSRPLIEEPVFWIVVGTVAAIGLGVAIGVGVATQSPGPPYQGNLGGPVAL